MQWLLLKMWKRYYKQHTHKGQTQTQTVFVENDQSDDNEDDDKINQL